MRINADIELVDGFVAKGVHIHEKVPTRAVLIEFEGDPPMMLRLDLDKAAFLDEYVGVPPDALRKFAYEVHDLVENFRANILQNFDAEHST